MSAVAMKTRNEKSAPKLRLITARPASKKSKLSAADWELIKKQAAYPELPGGAWF